MTSAGTESGVTRPQTRRAFAGFFRTTGITRPEQVTIGRIARVRREIPMMACRWKPTAGLIFHGGKRGDRNTTDQQSFSSIAASAVACGSEHDVDNRLSDEFHGRLPEHW